MTAQLFAVDEGVAQLLHDHLLPRRQTVGILGVDGREVGVLQGIRLSVDRDRPILEVDLVQQAALLHVVFGMARDELTFQLKEDDRDRLVDLAVHVRIVWLVALRAVDGKAVAGIARIGIERKLGKGQQVDAVPVLHRIEIAVLCRDAHDGRDAREAPARRAHPADVVIAPLEIDVVEAQKGIENDMRARTAVKQIAQNVDAVDRKALNEVAEGDDKVPRPLGGDDRRDDPVVVRLLVLDLLFLAQKFLDDIGVVARKLLPDARTGVLGGNAPVDAHKAIDRRLVPVVQILLRRLDLREFLLGIVDERRQGLLLLHGKRALELLLDLFADGPRAVLQDVQKRLVFPVDIRDEVLRALGQIERRGEIDDLRRRVCRSRKLNG